MTRDEGGRCMKKLLVLVVLIAIGLIVAKTLSGEH
jgi:uncharacterized protein HemY